MSAVPHPDFTLALRRESHSAGSSSSGFIEKGYFPGASSTDSITKQPSSLTWSMVKTEAPPG